LKKKEYGYINDGSGKALTGLESYCTGDVKKALEFYPWFEAGVSR